MSALVVRTLTLTGSGSRDILQPLADNDLSNEAFAWLSAQVGEVGYAHDVRLIRVSRDSDADATLFVATSWSGDRPLLRVARVQPLW